MGDAVSVKVRDLVDTPGYVVTHGWRDEPLTGPDSCADCEGYGHLSTVVQGGSKVHRTCPECKGRGWL